MKMKILCIDDSKSVHAFLRQCVSEVSLDFKSVFDGEEAIRLFSGPNPPSFDVIFLDWEMPKKTGPEVLDEIKRLKVQTPVIMLTSKNDVADISSVLSKGAHEYVMKPFTKDIIIEKLSSLASGGGF